MKQRPSPSSRVHLPLFLWLHSNHLSTVLAIAAAAMTRQTCWGKVDKFFSFKKQVDEWLNQAEDQLYIM